MKDKNYCGKIFNKADEVIDNFICLEELLDYRLNLYKESLNDRYVIFDNDVEKTKINLSKSSIESYYYFLLENNFQNNKISVSEYFNKIRQDNGST